MPGDYDPRKHFIDVTSPDHPHVMLKGESEETVLQDTLFTLVRQNILLNVCCILTYINCDHMSR